MPTQNVNITQAQADFIHQCVEAGDYNNASELVRDALRLLKEQKDEHQARVEYLRGELQKAYDAREEGRYIDLSTKEQRAAYFEDVDRRGRARLMKENREATASSE